LSPEEFSDIKVIYFGLGTTKASKLLEKLRRQVLRYSIAWFMSVRHDLNARAGFARTRGIEE